MKVTACRVCASTSLVPVLDLGDMPAVNYFPAREELSREAATYPLRLCLCGGCGLLTLDEVVAPELQYRDYHYLTSASTPLARHFAELARDCQTRGWVGSGTKVLDIGANDGTLLRELRAVGACPLGVDPSARAVRKARQSGIRIVRTFFSEASARRLARHLGRFDLVTCTNALAHVDDVKGFLSGIELLLAGDGVVVVEVGHVLDLVVRRQFDVIYHEHVSYFSLRALIQLFRACGLEIFDAKKVATQGGSLRIYGRRAPAAATPPGSGMEAILAEEDEHGVHTRDRLENFAEQVRRVRADLRALVAGIRERGQKIVGLGAPAKSVVLLQYCGLGPDDIAYLVDSTEVKQGRFLPGAHIPIYPEERLRTDAVPCDYFLLLSWNFQEALLDKIAPYRAGGAKVIVPFPTPHVI